MLNIKYKPTFFSQHEKKLWSLYQILYFSALVLSISVQYYEASAFYGKTTTIPYFIWQSMYFIVNLIIPLIVATNIFCILLSLFHFTEGPFYWKKHETLFGLLIFAVFLVSYCLYDYIQPYWFAVFIFGAHNINYRKLLKIYVVSSAILFIIIFICGCTGLIEDYTSYRDDGTIRRAFGFVYTTWPPTHLFFLSVCWAWLREERISYCEIGLVGAFAAFSYAYCNARTSFICLSVLFLFLLWSKWSARKNVNQRYQMTKPLQICSLLSFPIMALFMIVLSVAYTSSSKFLIFINRLLNNRLELGNIGFARYDILPFGQMVQSNTKPPGEYFILDCTYINILLRYGFLIFIAVMFICIYTSFRQCEKKRFIRLGILAIVAIKISVEFHIMEIDHTPILLYLLSFDPDDGEGFNLRAAFPKRKQHE